MRGGAHIGATGSPPSVGGEASGPAMPVGRPAEGRRHRIDDLVREIGGRTALGPRAAPFIWGFGGFLIGAAFWHLIGFWGFLSTVVLKGPEPQVSVVARQADPAMLRNCTDLALNRSTGQTYAVPCAEQVPVLQEARLGRQDLAYAHVRSHEPAQSPGQTSRQEN